MLKFRKATANDIAGISKIYEKIHTEEEKGNLITGWIRNVYPTEATAEAAVNRGDMYIAEDEGCILAAAVVNGQQVDVYADGAWEYPASDNEVMVLHTLVVDPDKAGKGIGPAFVDFYEQCAGENGCNYLRMDTNARNDRARNMYKKLGYKEIGIVPTVFNGIPNVMLVLLEKKLENKT